MKLCNEIITVFNRRMDADGFPIYYPTIIGGVSWYSHIITSVDNNGLHAADSFVIRIPVDANFGDSIYVDPVTYKDTASAENVFTLAQGDIVVKAAVYGSMTPKELHETYHECFTIQGVTDNRRAPNAPHWRVVGS